MKACRSAWWIVTFSLFTLAACTPSNFSVAAPSPSPSPGALQLSPANLSFTAAGTANAQSVSVSEPNYAGTFQATTTTCSGIATIAAAGTASFSVSPQAAGTCAFTIAGGTQSATLSIVVTTTSVGGS